VGHTKRKTEKIKISNLQTATMDVKQDKAHGIYPLEKATLLKNLKK
jgi:hypothetical protein